MKRIMKMSYWAYGTAHLLMVVHKLGVIDIIREFIASV